MPLETGDRLGPYEILAPIGAGGMGEVYRGRDTRLNREVAIKTLPAALRDDAQYMARFEREAQTLASLNHPNIATIYGIEQGALVMELVEGPTLADRIARGALPLNEALPFARQIAEGLEAAHERGIVHRDLKPANIKITPEGAVKLLDFGLAKTVEPASAGVSNSLSPTLSLAMTQAGYILGTAGYMSPEQARGKPVDRRADIWAYGVVLYEMLAGRTLFGGGETVSDALAAVLTREPDWDALPSGAPRALLRRCLTKDPRQRLRDIGEARIALDSPPAEQPAAAAAPTRRSWLPWAIAALLALAAAPAWWKLIRPEPPKPFLRFSANIGSGAELGPRFNGHMFALAPDASKIVFVGAGSDKVMRLGVRRLDRLDVTWLPATEEAAYPTFSPDGNWVAFIVGGQVKKAAADGSGALVIGPAPRSPIGLAWGEDGFLVAGSRDGLMRIAATGGAPQPLTRAAGGESGHVLPAILPGGKILFTSMLGHSTSRDTHLDGLDPASGRRVRVQDGAFAAAYLDAGYLVFMQGDTFFAAPFEPGAMRVTGPRTALFEDVLHYSGDGQYAVSKHGTLAYLGGRVGWELYSMERGATPVRVHEGRGYYFSPRVSPDGERMAFAREPSIWVKDLRRGAVWKATSKDGAMNPLWTPDGRGLIFRIHAGADRGLWWTPADGGGQSVRIYDADPAPWPMTFSPDGKRLGFSNSKKEGDPPDIFTAAFTGAPERPRLDDVRVFVEGPAAEFSPAFSPDGRWLAYVSRDSGDPQVYVQPFPGPGPRVQISTNGGMFPRWTPQFEIVYQGSDRAFQIVPCKTAGAQLTAGPPKPWSDLAGFDLGSLAPYDVTPDGKRLILAFNEAALVRNNRMLQLSFALNLVDEIRRRAAK